jgi:hypothetical protein
VLLLPLLLRLLLLCILRLRLVCMGSCKGCI